jgi:hypothetical protein
MLKIPMQVEAFIAPFVKAKGSEAFRKQLLKAIPSILKRMEKDKPREKGTRHGIRYVLYWLAKSVVKSGELADLWRDAIDDAVIAAALTSPGLDSATDEGFAVVVLACFVEQVF